MLVHIHRVVFSSRVVRYAQQFRDGVEDLVLMHGGLGATA